MTTYMGFGGPGVVCVYLICILIQLYVYTYTRRAFRGISFANDYTHTHIIYTQGDLKQTKTFLWTYAGEHRFMLYIYIYVVLVVRSCRHVALYIYIYILYLGIRSSEGRYHIRRRWRALQFHHDRLVMFDKHDPYTADGKRFIIKAHIAYTTASPSPYDILLSYKI